ncbi:MAG: hypothetical protein ABIU11_01360 [Chitinophagaceae bacterium]
MPFVSALAFTGTISLPLIFAVFLFMLMILKIVQSGKLPDDLLGFDVVIISIFLFFIIFSFVINGWGNSKSLNHTVGYLSTFLLFYVAIKFTLFSFPEKNFLFRRVLQFITYTTIISALYGNAEFITSNIFGINLNTYIPRPSEAEAYYDATVLGLFYRARGFAPESGHFTFMMELFSPLSIYYMYFSGFCKWRKLLKAFTVLLIILSIIFAVSSASFIIIPLAVLSASVLYFKKIFLYIKRHLGKSVINIFIAIVIIFIINYFVSLYSLIVLSVSDKLDSFSFDDREERINFFYDKFIYLDFIKKLSGTGPAGFDILGFDESKSILSLYHSITFELGFLGLLLIILLFIYSILNTLQIKSKIGFFLLISIISGVLHYYFIANFWYPWLWFIIVFSVFCNKKLSNG